MPEKGRKKPKKNPTKQENQPFKETPLLGPVDIEIIGDVHSVAIPENLALALADPTQTHIFGGEAGIITAIKASETRREKLANPNLSLSELQAMKQREAEQMNPWNTSIRDALKSNPHVILADVKDPAQTEKQAREEDFMDIIVGYGNSILAGEHIDLAEMYNTSILALGAFGRRHARRNDIIARTIAENIPEWTRQARARYGLSSTDTVHMIFAFGIYHARSIEAVLTKQINLKLNPTDRKTTHAHARNITGISATPPITRAIEDVFDLFRNRGYSSFNSPDEEIAFFRENGMDETFIQRLAVGSAIEAFVVDTLLPDDLNVSAETIDKRLNTNYRSILPHYDAFSETIMMSLSDEDIHALLTHTANTSLQEIIRSRVLPRSRRDGENDPFTDTRAAYQTLKDHLSSSSE